MRRWSLFPASPSVSASSTPRCGLVARSLGSGGLEEVVALLATELAAIGFETSVLCTHGGGPIAERLRAAGVSVTVADGSARAWRDWAKQVRPDVVSTHFVSLEAIRVLAKWAPVVETVHNTYVWLSPTEWQEERAKCAIATRMVAVSETVASFHRRNCGQVQYDIIPNGVQGARFATVPRNVARDRLQLGPDDIVFVHVGRFCLQKNQLGLIDALADTMEANGRVRLVLVGGHEDAPYVDRVHSQAGALIARDAVRLLPATRDPGLVLSAADAFVSNSFFEGWSLAATEALWLGRPVILSDCGGSRELIGDNEQHGFLVPNPGGDPSTLDWGQVTAPTPAVHALNREAMQRAIASYIANRDDWAKRGDEIAHRARSRWTAEQMAVSYGAVFRTVTGA